MNKKGFTLVELLAVLVLLALIAIIIVPNALRTTSKTEKKAFVESVKGIIRGVSEYYAETGGVLPLDEDCPLNNVDECLDITKIPSQAEIENINNFEGYILSDNGTYSAYNITDGVYCANGKRNSLTITDGNCE